jgi:hypothetical protein
VASCFVLPAASSSLQAFAGEEEQVSLPAEERRAPAALPRAVVSALAQAAQPRADDRCALAEALPDVPQGDWVVLPEAGWLAASAPHDSVVQPAGGWLEPLALDDCWVALLVAGWLAVSAPHDSVVQPAGGWLEPSALGDCWVALLAAGWLAVSAPRDSVAPQVDDWPELLALGGYSAGAEPVGSLPLDAHWVQQANLVYWLLLAPAQVDQGVRRSWDGR